LAWQGVVFSRNPASKALLNGQTVGQKARKLRT
jgi:hypothetical protein